MHHSSYERALQQYQHNFKKDKELVAFFKQNFSQLHKNNPNYLKLYYERALNINPMNAQIWDLYLKDVEIIVKQFKGFKEQTY